MNKFSVLNELEVKILSKLNTPKKIQDYLDKLPINFELDGDTCYSPREVLRRQIAHCMEGALLAAAALWYHGRRPMLLDLVTINKDDDHVVALFEEDGYWGAISKTNHGVLRWRDPVYTSVHELAMSYFHEYFLDDGKKTLRTYSDPFDLRKIKDTSWLISDEPLWHINNALADSRHYEILKPGQAKSLRLASQIEIEAGKLTEWKKPKI
ncbi:MAG TPA: hypothetical protein PKD34_02015 [Candidatus Doudnabacteria bacterium]|nr:hypothetical protein [Candidatus Doudnabacteria bacterium]